MGINFVDCEDGGVMERGFDINRLSNKVRSYIQTLELNHEALQKRMMLATGVSKSKVQIGPFSDREMYLDDYETIRFLMGDHPNYIDVRKEGNWILIYSGKSLEIRPQSSNVAKVKVGELFES